MVFSFRNRQTAWSSVPIECEVSRSDGEAGKEPSAPTYSVVRHPMGCDYCSIHLHLHLKKSWIKGTDRWKRVLVVGPVLRPIRKRRSSISLGRSSGQLRRKLTTCSRPARSGAITALHGRRLPLSWRLVLFDGEAAGSGCPHPSGPHPEASSLRSYVKRCTVLSWPSRPNVSICV